MKVGVILPGGTATEQLEQAVLAERADWDGVFVWEAAYGVDAWSLLAAMAARTTRIRLGTVLTPLPWRRPWKVASQVVTVDQLSNGRAILAVGVGAITTDLPLTGEVLDLRTRAAMLDEGIDLIRTLWSGEQHFRGEHYSYACDRDDLVEVGRPVQDPIPIWVLGAWPRPKSMRRALRCDGVIPQYEDEGTPGDARAVRSWLAERVEGRSYDVIAQGETPYDDPEAGAAELSRWSDAGCTWWLETRWEMPHNSLERMRQIRDRITAGPPRP
jgi:alkanesulfonate monooxygenase SsuD/methylene tetrahydromethanopterin reductase-like flavin-dependent oxidoreductase (luciferase family)